MIPKVIHSVWAGEDPIPHEFQGHLATWKQHHPDWDHRLWTPSEIDELDMVNRDLYDAGEVEAPNDWLRWRADVARLEIVFQHGGVYVDVDSECLKPFDPLLERSCWFAESPNATGHATQAVFAAEPQHPFIKHLLHVITDSAKENEGKRINHRVGSRFVDRNYHDFKDAAFFTGTTACVEMLPWRWFSAQSITDRDQGRPPDLSEAYCWHRYGNSDRHGKAKAQIAAFRAAADILDGAGVEWFLSSGLLLGHIREGRILPQDLDVDIGIWPDDVERVAEAFKAWTFTRNRHSQMWPRHPKTNTKIDIHTHYRDGDTVYKLHGKGENIRMDYPGHLFDDMRPSVFYARRTLIPWPAEEYLAHMYGDWTTPVLDWQWDQSPLNITRL